MNLSILALLIMAQVFVFQFAAVAFVRSVFSAVLGNPPEPLASKSALYLGKAGLHRVVLGGVLLLCALATLVGFPGDPTLRKILLAVVSVTSSGAFAWATVNDRRALRSMRDALPDAGVRRASLEPRAVSHWHGLVWDILPIVILLATVVLTIILGRRLGYVTTHMWVMQILQAVFVIGAVAYTFRRGVAIPNVSSRIAMLRDRPELALTFGKRLAAQEMQYFAIAKIGVALLLGISVAEAGLEPLNSPALSVLGVASWVIVGALLVLYAIFVSQIMILTRRMQHQVQRDGHEVNQQG
jgi:hypothetical protein